jgi:hypothetical protein
LFRDNQRANSTLRLDALELFNDHRTFPKIESDPGLRCVLRPKLHFRLQTVAPRHKVGLAPVSRQADRFRLIACLDRGVWSNPIRHRIAD